MEVYVYVCCLLLRNQNFNDRAALVHAARASPSEEISLSLADSVTLYHQHLLP